VHDGEWKICCAGSTTKLMSNKNVSFMVCAVALKAQGIDESQLIPGTLIVPDGIYDIISK
jgi:intracellular sulfur oxidation DsrE/DsrF family protein